jgi:hypothetical protein
MTSSRFHRRITMLAHRSARPKRLSWRPGAILVALLIGLLVASPALSALRLGTSGPDTLLGTKGNDHLTGDEGNDILIGKAGNDTYFFADGWGTDFLVEKPGEGSDTLNFHGVASGRVTVSAIRDWAAVNPIYTVASGPGGTITFKTDAGVAAIEKVIGGQGNGEIINTGGGPNTLMPGGGTDDRLTDYGGWNDGPAGSPEIPASNDTYKGFADNTGTVTIVDWGGSDTVDLRPLATADVYLSRGDFDGNGTKEGLQIVISPTAQVFLIGHYGPYLNFTRDYGQQGRIEKVIFADATFTTSTGLSSAMTASVETTSGKQAELAAAADRLAEEARAQLATMPEPGTRSGSVGGGDEGGPKLSGEPAKPHKADTKHTSATTDPHEKKPSPKGSHEQKQTTKTRASHEKKPDKATREKKHAAKDTKPRA